MGDFPNSKVIFDFYIQSLEVPAIQIIHLLGYSQTKILYIFCVITKCIISLITFSACLSFEYWKDTDLLELIW